MKSVVVKGKSAAAKNVSRRLTMKKAVPTKKSEKPKPPARLEPTDSIEFGGDESDNASHCSGRSGAPSQAPTVTRRRKSPKHFHAALAASTPDSWEPLMPLTTTSVSG